MRSRRTTARSEPIPDDELAGATDLSEGLLLLLNAVVRRTGANRGRGSNVSGGAVSPAGLPGDWVGWFTWLPAPGGSGPGCTIEYA